MFCAVFALNQLFCISYPLVYCVPFVVEQPSERGFLVGDRPVVQWQAAFPCQTGESANPLFGQSQQRLETSYWPHDSTIEVSVGYWESTNQFVTLIALSPANIEGRPSDGLHE